MGNVKELIEANIKNWTELCKQMLAKSYCVYSNFPVACVLVGDDNTIFTGCNVENSSYGLAICAERTAAVKAVSEGCKKFKVCVVMTESKKFVMPCGSCRQFLAEFGTSLVVVSAVRDGSAFKSFELSELLPHSFNQEELRDGVEAAKVNSALTKGTKRQRLDGDDQ